MTGIGREADEHNNYVTVTTEIRLSMLGQDNGNVVCYKMLSHVSAVPVKNAKAGFCYHRHIQTWINSEISTVDRSWDLEKFRALPSFQAL